MMGLLESIQFLRMKIKKLNIELIQPENLKFKLKK